MPFAILCISSSFLSRIYQLLLSGSSGILLLGVFALAEVCQTKLTVLLFHVILFSFSER